ncbi:sensor histidine kinase [Devosia chinhatensis]|uniref:Blue-light-activated histidine kinase n=1 Tax=Devosia chinhatensis TaxID=429727 RepID=A0A0F5FNM3_9HYPH|nr:histidine kinase dimerization/phosphoacceptor domain -containing protein [Devosia chinhatensis]KKB09787.1 histidine kinase [Devosia chinhatensis]
MTNQISPDAVEKFLETPDLADAFENERFRQFLDHMPFGVAVSEMSPQERIVYFNPAFAEYMKIDGSLVGKDWKALPECLASAESGQPLVEQIDNVEDHLGGFHGPSDVHIEAWSSLIEDDAGIAQFRMLAVVPMPSRNDALLSQITEKDTLLRELQHRVKNNLQMITALIRMEARQLPDESGDAFQRLAGRINSLALLYSALYDQNTEEGIDLGAYLGQVASAVMAAQAKEGIRLNLQVDTWPCSINVAMPTGLVVNELLTNALKHAFPDGEGGTIKLHALVDERGCKVIVADDGVGFSGDASWPKPGKLSALIVHSLRENAGASLDVQSAPGQGVSVEIFFARQRAEPEA